MTVFNKRTPVWTRVLQFVVVAAAAVPTAVAQDALITQAKHEYMELRPEEALQIINSYLVDNPLHPDAIDVRSRLLLVMGRSADALKFLERAPELNLPALLLKAECLALAGRTEDALVVVDQVLEQDNLENHARVTRAKILLKMGRTQSAINEASTVATIDPKNFSAMLVLGFAAEQRGDVQNAASIYQRMVAKKSEFKDINPYDELMAVQRLASLSRQMGRLEDAKSLFEQLNERIGEQAWVSGTVLEHAITLYALKEYDAAIAKAEKAVELAPEDANYRVTLGEIYQGAGRLDDAAKTFEFLVETVDRPLMPSIRLAHVYLENGQASRALTHAEVARQIGADDPDAWAVYGLALEKTGAPADARKAFEQAYDLDHFHPIRDKLVGVLKESTDPADQQRAAELIQSGERAKPYIKQIRYFQKQARSNSNDPQVMLNLGIYLNAAGEFEMARRAASGAVQLSPNNPQTHMLFAVVAANQGNNEDALVHFKKVTELSGQAGPTIQSYIAKLENGEALDLPLNLTPRDG